MVWFIVLAIALVLGTVARRTRTRTRKRHRGAVDGRRLEQARKLDEGRGAMYGGGGG